MNFELPPSSPSVLNDNSNVNIHVGEAKGQRQQQQQQQQQQRRGILSQMIHNEVKKHQLNIAIQQSYQRHYCFSTVIRKITSLVVLGIVPTIILCLHAIRNNQEPQNQQIIVDDDDDNIIDSDDARYYLYFITVSICGGLGAVLYSSDRCWRYIVARFCGGSMAALSSSLIIWMIIQHWTVIQQHQDQQETFANYHHILLAILIFIIFGLLGTMPGILVYFVITIITEECCHGCWQEEQAVEDYYHRRYHHDLSSPLITLAEVDDTV
jgi:hypothetical protein